MDLIDKEASFSNFGLDSRLVKAVSKMGLEHPTLVQLHGIPLALKGTDLLARARTGSGKTLAYLLPILQKILSSKLISQDLSLKAIILVPTVELCKQVLTVVKELIQYCTNEVKCIHISSDSDVITQKSLLAEIPDVLIATPGRLVSHLKANNVSLAQCEMMVIDEADLILSYGHKTDIDNIVQYLPEGTQSLLMSATLNKDVDQLKSLILHNPAVLKLEAAEMNDKLSQYSIKVDNDFDKYLFVYVLLKLKIVKGKALIFVNNIDRCFRLKIFLEKMSIKTALLNSELPQNSRIHILSEFNRGFFDCLIATDENFLDESLDNEEEDVEEKKTKNDKKKRKKGEEGEKEYGVTRGIDFKGVSNVINFDFPTNPKSYVHRAGRTARGGGSGNVLSFLRSNDSEILEKVEEILKEESREIKPFGFAPELAEGFRYRCTDVLTSVTKHVIQQARIKELKNEILNSKKLKAHFEDNPIDLEMLKHDGSLTSNSNFSHLKHIPLYLQPDIRTTSVLRATLNQPSSSENFRHKKNNKSEIGALTDPLKSFNFETPFHRELPESKPEDDKKHMMKKMEKKNKSKKPKRGGNKPNKKRRFKK